MADIFGIVTGAIGLMSPVEKFLKRLEAITDASSEIKELAQHHSELDSLLCNLQAKLNERLERHLSTDDLIPFCSVVQVAEDCLRIAKDELNKLEHDFPQALTSSNSSPRNKLWRLGKQCLHADRLASSINTISKSINEAKQSLRPLSYHLETYVAVKEISVVAKETLNFLKQGASTSDEFSLDKLEPKVFVPIVSPKITLIFRSADEDKNPVKMDGNMKKNLPSYDNPQNDSDSVVLAVGAAGMGDVEKTAQTGILGWEDDLRDRLRGGGVFLLSIGKNANMLDIIKQLGTILRSTGDAFSHNRDEAMYRSDKDKVDTTQNATVVCSVGQCNSRQFADINCYSNHVADAHASDDSCEIDTTYNSAPISNVNQYNSCPFADIIGYDSDFVDVDVTNSPRGVVMPYTSTQVSNVGRYNSHHFASDSSEDEYKYSGDEYDVCEYDVCEDDECDDDDDDDEYDDDNEKEDDIMDDDNDDESAPTQTFS